MISTTSVSRADWFGPGRLDRIHRKMFPQDARKGNQPEPRGS